MISNAQEKTLIEFIHSAAEKMQAPLTNFEEREAAAAREAVLNGGKVRCPGCLSLVGKDGVSLFFLYSNDPPFTFCICRSCFRKSATSIRNTRKLQRKIEVWIGAQLALQQRRN